MKKSKLRNLVPSGKLFNLKICNSRKEGFTLIEVLLALVILTVVLGAVYSSFFTVQRAIERFDGVSLKYHEARMALDFMRREIESAFFEKPQTSTSDTETIQTAFVIEDRDIFGKPVSELSLTAFSPIGRVVRMISYFVKEKDGSLSLIKTESPVEAISTQGQSIEILEGIEGFTVETLYKDKWIKTWDTAQTDKLPDIVKVSIEFDDRGKKVILATYAIPKIGKRL